MREDNPATEVMNSMAACIDACAMLCLRPSALSRDEMLDGICWFIEAAPLNDLPTVRSFGITKDMIRNGAAVAAKLQPEVLAWDGTIPPPPPLVNLAREFLVTIGVAEQVGVRGAAP
ncbi:MAG: hypothetical protein ABI134_08935 [Byssovorax sp.]